ncbi:transcriptional regulator NagR [Chelativorans composti]|jgi:Transcriptional regulators|uniref:GntR family transcriptional regulator n=1 Tax=Chelativorans composti TaxID=768533 RepID=A0ABW5DJF5_9HYPH
MLRSPIPKYFQIQELLRARIADGTYAVGQQLPPENVLAAELKVSRQSVRTALLALVNEGIITRTAGRGTFVTEPPDKREGWTIRTLEDVLATPVEGTRRVISVTTTTGKVHSAAARQLALALNEKITLITTARENGRGPYGFSYIFVPHRFGSRLSIDELSSQPVIRLIEKECLHRAARATQITLAVAVEREIAKNLGVETGEPVLLVQRTYFTNDGLAIEYAENYYRSDRYHHVMELLRSSPEEDDEG